MNMKADVNTGNDSSNKIESAGDATMISWSIFASLDELRQAPEPSPAASSRPAFAPRQPEAAPGQAAAEPGTTSQASGESLQDVLGQYTKWLSTLQD